MSCFLSHLSTELGVKVCILHLSLAAAKDPLAFKKQEGLVSHHLFFFIFLVIFVSFISAIVRI